VGNLIEVRPSGWIRFEGVDVSGGPDQLGQPTGEEAPVGPDVEDDVAGTDKPVDDLESPISAEPALRPPETGALWR
jgi:hypothetical protein